MKRQVVHYMGFIWLATVCVLGVEGTCFALSKPRLRISDFFGAPGGIDYLDPNDVGQHCYKRCRQEKVGMIYTRKAGFFDLGHVREGADRTRYVIDVLYEELLRSRKSFRFKVIEPSYYYLKVIYPENWEELEESEREEIAREVSIRFGHYLGHQTLVWHELLTWFGYASSGLFPEQISSFSWEDPYSDVVGTCLAAEAIRSGGDYDDEVTRLLNEKIVELQGEPAEVGEKAEQRIKGKWYTGSNYFFVEMKKRSFDVGYDDGLVTPWLVPGMFDDAEPTPCPAPDTSCLDEYGFDIVVGLDPRVSEKGHIFKALGLNSHTKRLRLDVHFPQLLNYIQKEAKKDNGEDVDKPTLQKRICNAHSR